MHPASEKAHSRKPALIHPHTYKVPGRRQAGLFSELPSRVLLGNWLPVFSVLGKWAAGTQNPRKLSRAEGMRRRPELLCCSGLLPSLYVIPQARRNVVVAPGRILSISSLVLAMLLLLLLGVVMPRVDAFVRQPTFVLLDVVHDGSKVCATPTGAPGAGGS